MGTRLPALREYIRDLVGDPAVDGESFDRAGLQTYMAERARNDPTSQNLNTLDEMLLLRGGGVPLILDGQVIGALGVAGAGGPAGDEGCAMAAIRQHLPAAS